MTNLHGTTTIHGSEPFKVPAETFIISPLTAAKDIYIRSIANGVNNPKKLDTTAANDYTVVAGGVPFTEYYIDTTETFYIKW